MAASPLIETLEKTIENFIIGCLPRAQKLAMSVLRAAPFVYRLGRQPFTL